MTLFQRKLLLFSAATILINALLFSTFALSRISMWIVSHDAVNAQMDREGALIEHAIAEVFMSRRGIGEVFIGTLVCSIGFLVFLWRTLFRSGVCEDSFKRE